MKRRKCINLNIKKIREKNHIKKLSIKRKRIRKGREKSKDQANPYDLLVRVHECLDLYFFLLQLERMTCRLFYFFEKKTVDMLSDLLRFRPLWRPKN